jgi:outer membrane cobalamin receptor
LKYKETDLLFHHQGSGKKFFLFSSSLEVEGNFQSLKPSLFVKVDDVNGQFLVNYGAGFGNNFKSFKFMGGFSLSYRVPTLIEQSVTGLSEAERHRIYEVSAEYETKGVILSFKVQNRSISNGVIFHDSTFYIANLRRTFLQFNSTFKIWKFGIDLKQSVSLNKVTKPYPRYFSDG